MKDNVVYKRKISFVDEQGYRATIECEIRKTDEGLEFSACGDYNGSGGQCLDQIKPSNEQQKKLIDLWHKYHLNGMHAGTEKQDAILEKYKDELPEEKKKSYYDWACAILKKHKAYEDNGYEYGGGWLHRDLPENFQDDLDELLDEIEKLEEERKGEPLTVPDEETDTEEICKQFWDMIEKRTGFTGRDAELCAAFIEMFDLSENDLDDIEINDTRCKVQGTDYLAGTDEEMDDAWDEELENYIDQCLEIPKEMEYYFDREKWKSDARYDGRGHALDHYNGGEEEARINGTDYYCYHQ